MKQSDMEFKKYYLLTMPSSRFPDLYFITGVKFGGYSILDLAEAPFSNGWSKHNVEHYLSLYTDMFHI